MLANPTRFRRIATGLSFLLAGAFWIAGMATTIWDDGTGGTAAYLDSLVVNPLQSQIAALLLHFGFLFLVPAVLGSLGVLTRRGVVLGHVAAILIVLCGTTLPGLLVTDFYDLSIAERLPRETGVAVSDGVGEYPLLFVLVLPAIFGTSLAVIVAAVALWRARIVHIAAPVIIAVGFLMGQFGPQGLLPSTLGAVVLAIGLAVPGVAFLRMDDAIWEAGGASTVDGDVKGTTAAGAP